MKDGKINPRKINDKITEYMKKEYLTPLCVVRLIQLNLSLMQSVVNPTAQMEDLEEEYFNW